MFRRDPETYILPEQTLDNLKKFFDFVEQQGWEDEELYLVVKLTQEMFV